jgi:3',5'-cyclic-AMP phosphodiesterase
LDPGDPTSRPLIVVQFSDPHIGADWNGADPAARLEAAVDRAVAMGLEPDAVLVSGDLSEHAEPDEYAFVSAQVSRLGAPVHALPGNHDRRAPLRAAFELPGRDEEPVQYAAGVGPLRLLALDTIVPGEEGGALDAERLGWLETELAEAPEAPTLIAMHHPPIRTGIPAFDEIGLPDGDRRAFAELVGRHRQVRRIAAGHIHRVLAGEAGGHSVLVAPSTYVQTALELEPGEIRDTSESPGFVVHLLIDGELTSHVQPLVD